MSGTEDIENIEPSKKKRKQEGQTINYCPIINPVQKVIKIYSIQYHSTFLKNKSMILD